jgi:hypothetical protein
MRPVGNEAGLSMVLGLLLGWSMVAMRADGLSIDCVSSALQDLGEDELGLGVLTGPEACRRLDEAGAVWHRPTLVSGLQDPMAATAAWQLSALEVWGAGRPVLLCSDDNAMAVVALRESGERHYELEPLETVWGFGSPLIGEWAVDCLNEIVDEVSHCLKTRPTRIVLTGLDPDAGVLEDLHFRFGRRFDLWISSEPMLHGSASLEGGVDGFLGRRSGNFRRKLRQQQRRAADAGVRFEHFSPTTREDADRCFARIVSVEQRSWKGLGRCGMDSPDALRFYAAMLRRLAALGRARIGFARAEDADIGFIFGGVTGSIYRGQQFSFDHDWSPFSIGNLLQFEQVSWCCEEGITRYDLGPLLGPRMAYKTHWAETELPIIACELHAVGSSGPSV